VITEATRLQQAETALAELTAHYDRAVRELEQNIRLLGQQGREYAQTLAWLQDIRRAAGATGAGISHQELCLMIQDMRRKAITQTQEPH